MNSNDLPDHMNMPINILFQKASMPIYLPFKKKEMGFTNNYFML